MIESQHRPSMRERELLALATLLDSASPASSPSTLVRAERLAHLYPFDPQVRATAARAAAAAGNATRAAAHLFLCDAPGDVESARARADLESRIATEALAVFRALPLRDVLDPARLQPAAALRMQRLLDALAAIDYPERRLEASLYAARRDLSASERFQAISCLSLAALAMLAVVALALVGVMHFADR